MKLNTIEKALDFYTAYLGTPRLNDKGIEQAPTRSKILEAMIKTQKEIGSDPMSLINKTLDDGGNLYFWSDHHYFHKKIIEYENRPFDSLEEMHKAFTTNYNSKIREYDVVVFGGDITFGNVEMVVRFLRSLPGKKILVIGNHDFNHKTYEFYDFEDVFDVITVAFTMPKKLDGVDYDVVVTHYPLLNVLPPNTINVHGHTHGRPPEQGNVNMSVEFNGYIPVCINGSLEKIAKKN